MLDSLQIETMEPTRPQFYPNTLQPTAINKENLELILRELQLAIKNSVNIISKNVQRPTDPSSYGNIYSGIPGIVLTLLRLERQKSCLQLKDGQETNSYGQIAFDLIMSTPTADISLVDGRISPIGSALGPVLMRILAFCENHNLQLGKDMPDMTEDFSIFNKAIEKGTIHGHLVPFPGYKPIGGDEVLFGRAGLLWAILTIEKHCLTEKTRQSVLSHLEPALECVPKLVEAIISAGKQGSQDFVKLYGAKDAMPLMYQWMEGHYALGAVHGTTGILTMLLSCNLTDDQLELITETVTGLCRVCIEQEGHFPMCIPERSAAPSRTSPFVQMCHGPPGLLILLNLVYQNTSLLKRFWTPEWELALHLGTEKIWEEGLLSKGASFCHGHTGNAWPLIYLHNTYEYNFGQQQRAKQRRSTALGEKLNKEAPLNSNFFLSRALPFMMLARESPPYSQQVDIKVSFDFRAPDRPYSFGEGLTGQVSAWAETCAVIKARLRKMELESGNGEGRGGLELEDDQFIESSLQQLGLFGFAVNGPNTNQLSFGSSLCQE
jgi:Lanthionine synthetase C-like protein